MDKRISGVKAGEWILGERLGSKTGFGYVKRPCIRTRPQLTWNSPTLAISKLCPYLAGAGLRKPLRQLPLHDIIAYELLGHKRSISSIQISSIYLLALTIDEEGVGLVWNCTSLAPEFKIPIVQGDVSDSSSQLHWKQNAPYLDWFTCCLNRRVSLGLPFGPQGEAFQPVIMQGRHAQLTNGYLLSVKPVGPSHAWARSVAQLQLSVTCFRNFTLLWHGLTEARKGFQELASLQLRARTSYGFTLRMQGGSSCLSFQLDTVVLPRANRWHDRPFPINCPAKNHLDLSRCILMESRALICRHAHGSNSILYVYSILLLSRLYYSLRVYKRHPHWQSPCLQLTKSSTRAGLIHTARR